MKNRIKGVAWRKSSKSNGQGACVEVAFLADGDVALRESDIPESVVITSGRNWDAFLAGVRNNEFDRPVGLAVSTPLSPTVHRDGAGETEVDANGPT
ncbi:DUF397 domain-containing protein [Kineosporia babensis]|uniref:DUF397 domain-containing protein n=1 Tax=Kineosporia babensis TaxID=499548 RepID=A0A9X1T4W3_9ACTN|nr:DUF397 domain-containing protein [Kineosporia babensis]MCD5317053.1 DUF397 domain-containing protein [Kineosporia babensis]